MCLWIKELGVSTTKEEITVYKVVKKNHDGYFTPYQGDHYPSLPFTKTEDVNTHPYGRVWGRRGYIIGKGYIHSHLSLEGAKEMALCIMDDYASLLDTPELIKRGDRNVAILKGRIPQSTEYIDGIDSRKHPVIASKSITLDEEVVCEDLEKRYAEMIDRYEKKHKEEQTICV